jgi:calcium/calmodulin-dependent protein kinase (CaM kinase) II
MTEPREQELLDLTRRLLDAIAGADWKTYEELCDPSLTCFEPEAAGQQVEGLEFHRFYFRIGRAGEAQVTMVSPRVRIMGDAAVVSYVRLVQRPDPGGPLTRSFEETRMWQRRDGRWKHVHFHRSVPTPRG